VGVRDDARPPTKSPEPNDAAITTPSRTAPTNQCVVSGA
jgi:hypothetical protein